MRTAALALITTALVSPLAFAQDATTSLEEKFSGNVAMTTDYTFRGISQSDESMAIQGGFDYDHGNGFYAGAWASSVDFNENPTTTDGATAELDIYAGYAGSTNMFDYDLGAIYYYYPGADDNLNYDFFEVYAGVSKDLGPVTAGLSFNYSPEYYGKSGTAYYTQATLEAAVPGVENLTANAALGYQTIEHSGNFGAPNYADWTIGLTYNVAGFDLGLAYVDTSLSKSELADGGEGRGVFSVSRSF